MEHGGNQLATGADLDCEDYHVLTIVQGSIGLPPVTLGVPGRCRFCGETNIRAFHNVAHTLPEAFGNKWITSLDECDVCNARFGAFDDALAKSMGAVLTVGGVKGKQNKVRQTGRSKSSASIRHSHVDGRPSISFRANGADFGEQVGGDPRTGELVFSIPGGTERFIPARAYKALVKMAVGVLPVEELPDFSRVIAWLNTPDEELLPFMVVGLSFANIGNPPPVASATLLRRTSDRRDLPHTIFITSIGAVCLQIVLKADTHDGSWPSLLRTRPDIRWQNQLTAPGIEPIVINFDTPVHLDWARTELEPPVIEKIVTRVHPPTQQARIMPVVRSSAIASSATQ
jgi:hypothetical protein